MTVQEAKDMVANKYFREKWATLADHERVRYMDEVIEIYSEQFKGKNVSSNSCVSGNEATSEKIKESGEVAVCHRCKEKGDMFIDTDGNWRCARCHEAAN